VKLKLSINWPFLTHHTVPSNRPIQLGYRQIFIIPTRRGLGFVVLIALLMLIAFIYNNNLAYLLAFLLASIFFITILHSYRSLAGLTLSLGKTHPAFVGEAVGFDIMVSKPDLSERHHLQLTLLNKTLEFSLSGEQKKTLTLYQPSQQRGWQTLAVLTLSSGYPLGFFYTWSRLHFSAKALVYPKPSPMEIPFPVSSNLAETRFNHALNPDGQDDFYGIREYQPGDAIKHIHWKAFAKGLGVLSKQYAGETSNKLWLDYEQTPGQETEQRISQLCRWLIDAEQQGLSYGFSIPGTRLQPAQGKAHQLKCLQALALL